MIYCNYLPFCAKTKSLELAPLPDVDDEEEEEEEAAAAAGADDPTGEA